MPTPAERLKKLCDLAVAMGHINFSQSDEALGSPDAGGELGQVLLAKGWVTADQLRELQKEVGRWEGSTNRYVTSPAGPPPAPPRPVGAPPPEPFDGGSPPPAAAPAPAPLKKMTGPLQPTPEVPSKKDQFLEDIINRRRHEAVPEPERPMSGPHVSASDVGESVGRAVNIVVGAPTKAVGSFLQKQWKIVAGAVAGIVVLIVAITLISSAVQSSAVLSGLMDEAKAAEKESRYDDARKKYQEVLEKSPGHSGATSALAKLEDEIKKRGAAADEAAAKQRELDRAKGRLDQAQKDVEQAYRIYTFDEGDPRELLREAEEAEADIKLAREKLADTADMHVILGHSWLLRGSEEKAEEEWRKAIEMKSDCAEAHAQIGRLRFLRAWTANVLGEPTGEDARKRDAVIDQAETELKLASGLPDDVDRRVASLMIDLLRGRLEAVQYKAVVAIEHFKDSGRREGVFEIYWLAGLSASTNEKRMEYLGKALDNCRNHPLLLYSRAREKEKEKDYKGAIADYTRAIKMSPFFSAAYAGRAQVRFMSGEPKEAASDFQKALETAPADWIPRARVKAASAVTPSPTAKPSPTTTPKPSPRPSPTKTPTPSPKPSPSPSKSPSPTR